MAEDDTNIKEMMLEDLRGFQEELKDLYSRARALHKIDNATEIKKIRAKREKIVAEIEALKKELSALGISQTQSFKQITLPSHSQLMRFDPDTTDLDLFFEHNEARLIANDTPKSHWYKLFGVVCSSSTLAWAKENILDPQLDWDSARELFSREFTHSDAKTRAREHLLNAQQGSLSFEAFLREVRQMARSAGQDLDDPFFLEVLVSRSLRPECSMDLMKALRKDIAECKFQDIRTEGLRLDKIYRATKSRRTKPSPRPSPSPSERPLRPTPVSRPCAFPGCGSTAHHFRNCPKRLALKCTLCGKLGHLAKDCLRSKDLSHITCHKCGKKGHYANKCPERSRAPSSGPPTPTPTSTPSAPLPSMRAIRTVAEQEPVVVPLSPEDADELLDSLRMCVITAAITPSSHPPSPPPPGIFAPCVFHDVRAQLLVDSASAVSAITPQFRERLRLPLLPDSLAASPVQLAGNGSLLPRLGQVSISTLRVGSLTLRNVRFWVMDISDSVAPGDGIVGVDLFPRFGFRVEGVPVSFPPDDPHPDEAPDPYSLTDDPSAFNQSRWLEQHQAPPVLRDRLLRAIQPDLDANSAIPSSSFCTHPSALLRLPTGDAAPVYVPQYRLADYFHPFVDDQLEQWLADRVIVDAPATSPWNHPLLGAQNRAARAAGKPPRICIDPRRLNIHLPSDPRPIPDVAAILQSLSGFSFVSELDLTKSFNQFLIAEEDRIKTTFTWKGRRYMFQGAPFGLKPLSQLFQSVIAEILYPHRSFCVSFIDNIYVRTVGSMDDHINHVQIVIRVLNRWQLRLNSSKCHFGYTALVVLGHVLTPDSVSPDPAKIQALRDWPVPTTGKHIMQFLGFTNYLRDHIPLYAELASPLEPLRKCKRLDSLWTPACQRSFEAFLSVLSQAPVLHDPLPALPYRLSVDASQSGLGLVLWQRPSSLLPRYILFAAKSLNAAQRNYSATRRELLAICWAVQRCRDYLYGRHFTLETDHKALTYLFTQQHFNYMMLNWIDTLLDYDFTVVHCPGILNILPDALSRIFSSLRGGGSSAPRMNRIATSDLINYPEHQLCQFINERFNKELVLVEDRNDMLERAHSKGHFGADALFKEIWHNGFYWPNLRKDCIKTVATCLPCLKFNVGKRGFHPQRFIIAQFPFEHIAADTISGLPTTPRGKNYILVIKCLCTRYRMIYSQESKSAKDTAWSFWLCFSVFPLPKIIQSDNGTEFVNQVMRELVKLLQSTHRFITAYNPRANGSAENDVGTVQDVLHKICNDDLDNWDLYLPAVQLAMNTKPNPSLKSSPASLLFGTETANFINYDQAESRLLPEETLLERINVLHSIIRPEINQIFRRTQETRARRANQRQRQSKPLALRTQVMLKNDRRSNKNQPRWNGPYTIVARKDNNYTLQASDKSLYPHKPPRDKLKPIDGYIDMENTFEVEAILKHRGENDAIEYLVKWRGYPSEHNTWEPLDSLLDCQTAVQAYWDQISPEAEIIDEDENADEVENAIEDIPADSIANHDSSEAKNAADPDNDYEYDSLDEEEDDDNMFDDPPPGTSYSRAGRRRKPKQIFDPSFAS